MVLLLTFYSELLLQAVICYICLALGKRTALAETFVQPVENQDGTVTERIIVRRQSLMVEAQSVQR